MRARAMKYGIVLKQPSAEHRQVALRERIKRKTRERIKRTTMREDCDITMIINPTVRAQT